MKDTILMIVLAVLITAWIFRKSIFKDYIHRQVVRKRLKRFITN